MKRKKKDGKTLLRTLSGLAALLFCASLLLLPAAADFQHNDKPDAGCPTELMASYDFDAAKAAEGQTVWALEHMRIYKCYYYWPEDGTEEGEYSIKNINLDESGGSLTVEFWGDDTVFTPKFRLPGKAVDSPEKFQILTFNSGYEGAFDSFWGPGTISVIPSTETDKDLNGGGDYLEMVTYGTEAAVDGESARIHDLSGKVPAAEVGATFRISLFTAYYAIDLDYVVPDPAGGIVQIETTEAEQTPGEDAGVEIKPEIITPRKPKKSGAGDSDTVTTAAVSVGGALAAAGALGAAAGKTKGGEEEKKKRYKMYVYKGFGDAIQKGASPARIYARISQIIDGKEYDCPEQTEKISVSGENLNVRPAGIEGAYMAAEIAAEPDTEFENGTVTFTLTGPGGMIQRNIVFRLVNEPQIAFPGELEGGHWDLSVRNDTVQMVAGEGGKERLRFVFVDAVEEPRKISFVDADGFDIEAEKDTKLAFTYYACIENFTPPAEKESGVFAELEERAITIEAEFDGHVIARDSFTIQLYPDGLTVLITGGPNPLRSNTPGMRKVLKNGWMEVISYATRDKEELTLDPIIPATDFDPCYAAVKPDGKALITRKPQCFAFEELESTDEETRNILAKYHYEVHWHQNGYALRPKDSIPEMEKEYYVRLPMSASVGSWSAQVDVPVRLLGEPFDPMKGWNAEFRGLCETAIRYFPGDVAHGYVQYIREHFSDPNLWDGSELRAMRYDVIRASQEFWSHQYNYEMRLVAYYDLTEIIFKKPARFMGDIAFKIVIKYYCGQNEGWITPLKDIIVDTIDDALWSYAETGTPDWNITENILNQAVNAISNYIQIADSKGMGLNFDMGGGDTQKLALALVCFMLADMIKNYYSMDPKDFFECVRKSFLDLSTMAIQKIVGAGLLKAANSQWVQKFFALSWVKATTDYLKKNVVSEVARGQATIIDPKTGIAKIQETRIIGSVDPRIADNKEFVHFGQVGTQADAFGKVSPTMDAGDVDLRHRLLGGPGQDIEVQLVNFGENLITATYRDAVQTVLDNLFGTGIAILRDNLDDDPNSDTFGTMYIPVYTSAGKKKYAVVNLFALFTTGAGLSSPAFSMVFKALFGGFSFPSGHEAGKDVGRAVLGFSGINPK